MHKVETWVEKTNGLYHTPTHSSGPPCLGDLRTHEKQELATTSLLAPDQLSRGCTLTSVTSGAPRTTRPFLALPQVATMGIFWASAIEMKMSEELLSQAFLRAKI